jgi:hypothetical protein
MMQMFFANRKLACGVAPTIAPALLMPVRRRCGVALETAGFCDTFAGVAHRTRSAILRGLDQHLSNNDATIARLIRDLGKLAERKNRALQC